MKRKKQIDTIAQLVSNGTMTAAAALREAVFIGACEARNDALNKIMKIHVLDRRILVDYICRISIMELLGYEVDRGEEYGPNEREKYSPSNEQ